MPMATTTKLIRARNAIRYLREWQARFIVRPLRLISLGVAWLTQNAAGTTLRDSFWPQTATHGRYCAATAFRAYQFPLAAALRISISRACSTTIFIPPCVLFLNSLQLLGDLRLHTTVLLWPAIIRLFGHFKQRFPAAGRPRAPSCPYRVQHPLYADWQQSDPLCDVSEAF